MIITPYFNFHRAVHRNDKKVFCLILEQVMLACGKYNLVHEFFKKVQKSSIPNALVYKGA